MNVANWQSAWSQRVYTLSDADAVLPRESRAFLADFGLPQLLVFEWGEHSFEISFAPLTTPLVPYKSLIQWNDDYDPALDEEWGKQWVIGDEEFCSGHASYCVHAKLGCVSRIDVEAPTPQQFVNSSVPQFAESLFMARQWSASVFNFHATTALRTGMLEEGLLQTDRKAFEAPGCFWPMLIEEFRSAEPDRIDITDDLDRSKPRF